jgi:hypothetical protein
MCTGGAGPRSCSERNLFWLLLLHGMIWVHAGCCICKGAGCVGRGGGGGEGLRTECTETVPMCTRAGDSVVVFTFEAYVEILDFGKENGAFDVKGERIGLLWYV